MNETIRELVKLFFQKDSIEECSLQELQNMAKQYPYFTPVQLLLAEKMRSQHPLLFQKQLQKTSLYFNNPLWFDFLLNKEQYLDDVIVLPKADSSNLETKEEPVQNELKNKEPIFATETIQENQYETGEMIQQVEEEIETGVSSENEKDQNEGETQQEIHIPPFKEEPLSADTPLSFEPYHTVDYFASQGIKLTFEENPKDRFGQQLKSFTDWLKSMKRLPESEINRNLNTGSEQKVEQLAQHSLEDREILTEAMAEVWEKQGNNEKAIEIYNKLSLLNPSKTAYFAAKIEQLKKEN